MSTLERGDHRRSASALTRRARAHRSRPSRTWPTPSRRAAPTASRTAAATSCSTSDAGRSPSTTRSGSARRDRRQGRRRRRGPGAVPPPLRAVASGRGRRRLRRAAERRSVGRNGGHAGRRARLSGEPHRHRSDSRHWSQRALELGEVSVMAIDHVCTRPTSPASRRRRRRQHAGSGTSARQSFGDGAQQARRRRSRGSATQANTAVDGMLDGTGRRARRDDRAAARRDDAAADRADPQQAGAGVPGRHADAGLEPRWTLHRGYSTKLLRASQDARIGASRPQQTRLDASAVAFVAVVARRRRLGVLAQRSRRTRCCSPTWTRRRPPGRRHKLKAQKVPYQLDDGGRSDPGAEDASTSCGWS